VTAYLVLASVGLLLALLVSGRVAPAALFFVKGQQQRLHIVETLTVGPRQKIAIIRCDQQEFVIGLSPQGIQSIGSVNTPTESSSS